MYNKNKWLSKAEFENGYIINTNRDTIDTKLLKFKKSKKMNSFLFCVTKDASDSIRIISAENLFEYRIGKTVYKKAEVKNEHFFIKQISTGEVTLFEREPIPSDYNFKYYLKRKNQQGYYEICPNESDFQIIGETNSYPTYNQNSNNSIIFKTGNLQEKFKMFVNIYFSGCEKIRNMVNSEIYSINNISEIVETYNTCAKNN